MENPLKDKQYFTLFRDIGEEVAKFLTKRYFSSLSSLFSLLSSPIFLLTNIPFLLLLNRRKAAAGKSVTISRVPFSYFCQASLCMPFHSEVKRSGSTYKVNFLLPNFLLFGFVSFCVVTFVGSFHDD